MAADKSCSTESCTNNSCVICDCVVTTVALAVSAASVWLSVGMELRACPLCLYQRAFMFSAAAVLVVGLLMRRSLPAGAAMALALAPAVAGLGVAGFHVSRELAGKMECPAGIAGIGSAPQQALLGQALLVLMLVIRTAKTLSHGRFTAMPAAAALGVLAAYGAVIGAPPSPAPVPAGDPQTQKGCLPIQQVPDK